MRLFVAIDPGMDICAPLERAMADIRLKSPGSKWVRADGLHITLVFLGEVKDTLEPDVVRAVEQVARSRGPIAIRVKGGGTFGSPRKPRVLWVGVEEPSGELVSIQRDLSAAMGVLGIPPEDRPYSPHITLARARGQGGDPGLAACRDALASVDFGEARIDELVLFRSDRSGRGAIYTPISRPPLE